MIERLVDAALELSVVGSYSRIGYAIRSRLAGWTPPRRVDGRVALVTGGTSGIGRAIASSLAGIGATVVVVGRDQARGNEVAREIGGATGNDHVSFERADLSDLSAVRELAARVARTYDRLDILVHNAGVLSRDYQRTDDGLELTVAVHVVGPFLLTQILLPLLQAADAPRVITMSSGGMYTQRLDVGALDPIAGEYDGVRAYAWAKRAQVELTRLWEQHEGPTGVRFVSMHPGWVATPGIESSLPSFNRLMRPILRTAEEGADTALWLAASPDSQLAGVASGSIDTPVGNIACPGRTPRPAKRLDSGPGASPGREERQHRRLNSAEWRRRSVVERHEVELSETVGVGDQFDLDDAARRRSCSRRRPAGVPPGPHEPHRSVQQPRSGGVRPPRELRSQGPSPTHPCGAGRSDPRPGAMELTRFGGHLIFPRFSALGFLGW